MENLFALPTSIASWVAVSKPLPEEMDNYGGYYIADVFIKKSEVKKSRNMQKLFSFCEDLLSKAGSKKSFLQKKASKNVSNFFVTDVEDMTEEQLSYLPEELHTGYYKIRAKQRAEIKGRKVKINLMDEEGLTYADGEAEDFIEVGAKVRLVVSAWYSKVYGETIGLNLKTVQFIEETDLVFPEGSLSSLNASADLLSADDAIDNEVEDDEDEDEEEVKPKKARSKAKSKKTSKTKKSEEDSDDMFED